MRSDYKILFLYPNIQQCAMMPYSIGLMTALLKREEFNVGLFDCTFYLDDIGTNYEHFQNSLRQFDWNERGVHFKENSMREDWIRKVEEFAPNMIAVSVVESTYSLGRQMIECLPKEWKDTVVLWGGVFATFGVEKILGEGEGEYVSRGEGELSIVEFCKRARDGGRLDDVPNIWTRQGGKLIGNQMRSEMVNLDDLPFADYSLFDDQAIYRPMQGRVWRTVGLETQRGCPYTCTYCNTPSQHKLAKDEFGGNYFRKKSMKRLHQEISYYQEKYAIELIYMLTDTFLAVSSKEFDELVEMYTDFRIPFWMNTRSETMTKDRAKGLDKMNMLRMSFGIEHGNPDYRKNMLKRRVTNEVMIDGFRACADRSFVATGNCIVGMPEENRDLAFDTINFCRELPEFVEQTGSFVFAPFHGTELRNTAVRNGYYDDNLICEIDNPESSMLDQPQFPRAEVLGLAKTFGLYQVVPKSEWQWVQVAERETNEGKKIFEQLVEQYLGDK